jgi:hypothetical protein
MTPRFDRFVLITGNLVRLTERKEHPYSLFAGELRGLDAVYGVNAKNKLVKLQDRMGVIYGRRSPVPRE